MYYFYQFGEIYINIDSKSCESGWKNERKEEKLMIRPVEDLFHGLADLSDSATGARRLHCQFQQIALACSAL